MYYTNTTLDTLLTCPLSAAALHKDVNMAVKLIHLNMASSRIPLTQGYVLTLDSLR